MSETVLCMRLGSPECDQIKFLRTVIGCPGLVSPLVKFFSPLVLNLISETNILLGCQISSILMNLPWLSSSLLRHLVSVKWGFIKVVNIYRCLPQLGITVLSAENTCTSYQVPNLLKFPCYRKTISSDGIQMLKSFIWMVTLQEFIRRLKR